MISKTLKDIVIYSISNPETQKFQILEPNLDYFQSSPFDVYHCIRTPVHAPLV